MTILDTIPIYDTPIWLFVICATTLAVCLLSYFTASSRAAAIIAGVSFILFLVSFCLIFTGACDTYSHDEYVVTLNDSIPATFFRDYQLVKEFKYSDAIQVREKNSAGEV